MKTRFILNPCSGANARDPQLLPRLESFLRTRRLDAEIVLTVARGHATSLARGAVAAGCARVVAVGGDGTLNEVAQGLLHTDTALAVIPRGSGNGLARHLRLPLDLDAALALLANPAARAKWIDAGRANRHVFFNVMGFGFDAEIVHRFNQLTRRGFGAYISVALRAFRARSSVRCIITSGGARHELSALLVAIANSEQYGNNARIAPGARIDDGLLDLVAIRPLGALSACALGARLFTGSLDRSPRVLRLASDHIVIEREAAGLIHTDGETHATTARVEITALPRALRVLVPPLSS